MDRKLNKKDRSTYLSIAERKTRAGSGTHKNVLRERTQRYGSPDLAGALAGIPFVVVGGFATRLYMPERMTLDADVLVVPSVAAKAEASLNQAGCKRIGPLTIGGSSWRLQDGSSLDLIVLDEPWVEEAIANPVRGKDGLPYIDLPFLVLMKLDSGRVQDLADITRMLGGASARVLRRVRQVVGRWRAQDVEDLESMIRLGNLEYQDGENDAG